MRLFEGRVHRRVTIEPGDYGEGANKAEELILPCTENETLEQREAIENEAIYACPGYAALVVAGYSEEDTGQGCGSDFQRPNGG